MSHTMAVDEKIIQILTTLQGLTSFECHGILAICTDHVTKEHHKEIDRYLDEHSKQARVEQLRLRAEREDLRK